jgi:hypothetical protein
VSTERLSLLVLFSFAGLLKEKRTWRALGAKRGPKAYLLFSLGNKKLPENRRAPAFLLRFFGIKKAYMREKMDCHLLLFNSLVFNKKERKFLKTTFLNLPGTHTCPIRLGS